MCTYYRTIKDGSVKEFKFELDRNKYILTNFPEIKFDFTVEEKFIHFTIDTGHKENMGYGTALLSIIFDYSANKNFDFICGWLSSSDYYNGNWQTSIPFYLNINTNSFMIKESQKMRNIYPTFSNFVDFYNNYEHYYNYEQFTQTIYDGYIIYPLVAIED